ncbi:MAG: WYL domain-containing protein [Alphaproteobacteria bacterium]
MRFEQTERLMSFILDLQAARQGLSLSDMQDRYSISYRTAQRMKDAAERLLPQIEMTVDPDQTRRWRLPRMVVDRLIGFTAEELATLDQAQRAARASGDAEQTKALQQIARKVRALQPIETNRRLETDVDALVEAQGLAFRPGPRPRVDGKHLPALREAILACKQVWITYRKGNGEEGRYRLHPYGLLYGARHYLLAFVPDKNRMQTFRLDRLVKVEPDMPFFERQPGFSIDSYLYPLFGVYEEPPTDIEWRFTPRAADHAEEFIFHPSQTSEREEDGSLTVRFRAGGLTEMAWHLLCWGKEVEVIKPVALRKLIEPVQRDWASLP